MSVTANEPLQAADTVDRGEEMQESPAAAAKVAVLTDEDIKVGGRIKIKLEDIFSRASEALPLYHELGGAEAIAKELGSDPQAGIPEDTVEQRVATFGKNELPEEETLSFLAILKDAWSDHMIIILAFAAVIALIIGLTVPHGGEKEVDYSKGWIEGVAILISITLVTTIASVNDYRKELKFRKLTMENSKLNLTVLRDRQLKTIDVSELVVGDVANINPGLVMPCDGLFLRGIGVVIDESSVTGENDPKKKTDEAPFLLTGTVVNTAENCYILVCAVGENSFGGKLLMEARGEGTVRATPLQERLDDMADQIGKVGISVAVVLFVALSIREAVRLGKDEPGADAKRFLEYFIISIAIIAVAVPEGLPLAVTISLAFSQNRMRKDNNQVRRLKACETMGNATTICSDKTGTLTQNLMSVVQGHVSARTFRVKKPGEFLERIEVSLPERALELLTEGIAVNSSSVKTIRTQNKEGTTIAPKWVWDLDKGNKTDNALLDLVDRVLLTDADMNDLKSLPHQRLRATLVDGEYTVFPFTSDRKRMSTVVKRDGRYILHLKGGADQVLPHCDTYLNDRGETVPMGDNMRAVVEDKIKNFAMAANRNIGMAFKDLGPLETLPTVEPEGPYTWLGLVGIQDPLRPEVIEAVERCQHAGVVVRMCTGDHLDTAIAISRQCGIYNHGDIAMTGREFRDLVYDSFATEGGPERLSPILQRMTVLARSQPLDKQLLVLMHMVRGEVVAVTGDGTNDAPALRLANVGFVMRSGTDIAVKSADIVLLDDNFRSVQRAVVWGRTVNDNIRKFLQLQLTVNVVSVFLTLIGSLSSANSHSPLTTIQLLWINLIMDTFAALALATEAPCDRCLNRGPTSRKSALVSRRMALFIGTQAAYQLALTLTIQHAGHTWFNVVKDSDEHRTIVFNIFVWCTIFNMFNARKLYQELNIFEGFGRSHTFLIIIAITVTVQVFGVEFFRDFLNTRPLKWDQWLGCLLAGVVVLPICFLQRLIDVPEKVVPKSFEPEELDDEAKNMLDRLEAQIAARVEAMTDEEREESGRHLAAASKRRMQSLWRKAAVHHVHHPKIVKAFRRAHADRDMRDPSAVAFYEAHRHHH